MSIRFPDWQVLVTRTEQIPKMQREGDQSGAGKLAPQITDEYVNRQKKVTDTPKEEPIPRSKKQKDEREQERDQERKQNSPMQDKQEKERSKETARKKRHIDILA